MTVAGSAKLIVNPSLFPDVDAIRERALHELIARLRELEGDNLIRVILYGSVARGDARENSDTDVLILLRDENGDPIDRISHVVVDVDMGAGECCTHITPNIFDLEAFHHEDRYHGFFKNLDKDGVILYDTAEYRKPQGCS